MKRNYIAGNDYEIVIKLTDGEERSFLGNIILVEGKRVTHTFNLYTYEELQKLGKKNCEYKLCPDVPFGDITLVLKNECVLVEKDHKIIDEIPRYMIKEIVTLLEGKKVE